MAEKASFKPTKIEVWRKNGRKVRAVIVPAVHIVKENGSVLYPPMRISEARRYCKENNIEVING
jgi:hypothetical protein